MLVTCHSSPGPERSAHLFFKVPNMLRSLEFLSLFSQHTGQKSIHKVRISSHAEFKFLEALKKRVHTITISNKLLSSKVRNFHLFSHFI